MPQIVCSDDLNDILDKPAAVPRPGLGGVTPDGVNLPTLPTTAYSYVDISQDVVENFKANGSFRLEFSGGTRYSVAIGGYLNFDGEDDIIRGKTGGGHHTDDGNLGRCYISDIYYTGDRYRVEKEFPHPENHETGIDFDIYPSLGDLRNRWVGVIFTKINVIVNGEECVRLQAYVDLDGMDTGTFVSASQNWRKIADNIDTGDWYGKAWLTPYDTDDSQTTIRCDKISSFDHAHVFVATITGGPAS